MLIIIIIIVINCALYKCDQCVSVCASNKNCLDLCKQYSNNPERNPLSLPHCGLANLTADVTNRVVNGKEAGDHSYPWAVSFHYDPLYFFPSEEFTKQEYLNTCSGVILNEYFILTAAHCFEIRGRYEPNPIKILIGSNELDYTSGNVTILEPEKMTLGIIYRQWIKVHDEFEDGVTGLANTAINDIALIKTSKPMQFKIESNRFVVNSICLPEKADFEPTGWATIAGWGNLILERNPPSNPYKLQEVTSLLITRDQCNTIFDESNSFGMEISELHLCAIASMAPGADVLKGYSGPYASDSGASYIQIHNDRAYSIGILMAGFLGVEDPIPAILLTRVSKYSEFIEQSMKLKLDDIEFETSTNWKEEEQKRQEDLAAQKANLYTTPVP